MEMITLLAGVKLVVDIFDNNWTGIATGILLPPPASELYTIGDSAYYLFDINGNRIGSKDPSNLEFISYNKITLKNEAEVRIGLQAAKKNISLSSNDDDISLT